MVSFLFFLNYNLSLLNMSSYLIVMKSRMKYFAELTAPAIFGNMPP